ncbi:MAG TPA: cytochrome P450 [Blastococcus sp.]|jgi:cytochrome P450 monooxygenase
MYTVDQPVDQQGLMASDLPVEHRTCPHLRRATRGPAVRRVRTPAGDGAWLVSGHAEVQDLLRDDRLGRSHPAPDERAQYAKNPTYDHVPATDHALADAMHGMLRTLLKPHFTARRMLAMRPRVDLLAGRRIDVLLAEGPPADLRASFSEPLIRQVFCDLYGVPEAESEECAGHMRRVAQGDFAGLAGYLPRLVAAKRAQPDDALVSRLCATGISTQQVCQVILVLEFAGFGATRKQLDYGLLLLAEHPEERAAITADPSLLPSAVEELLRLSGSLSLPRFARQDIEIGGVTIGAGDLVLLDLTRANYDGTAFDDPTTLDIARSPNRHVTFSHGVWTCLGAPLARTILAAVFEAVLTRMPDLRPAQPVSGTSGPLSGGLPDRLEFTW